MKNLSNCKPSEFLAQTIKIKNLVRDWLDATKIMDIRKNFSKVDKNLPAEERTNAIVNQALSNWSDMGRDFFRFGIDGFPSSSAIPNACGFGNFSVEAVGYKLIGDIRKFGFYLLPVFIYI